MPICAVTDFTLFKSIKYTKSDIKDAACPHAVHILQHPTSHASMKLTQNTMVNALKKNLSPLPPAKHCKSTQRSTSQRHQANEGDSCLEAEWVRAVGALRSLGSNKKLAAVKRWKTHSANKKEMDKWIKDHVDSETTVARKRVEDAETAIKLEQQEMRNADKAVLTTTNPGTLFEEMLNALRDCLSDLACSNDGGGWGRWGWWWRGSRAGLAERRWQTRLGDGHNPRNGAASHGAFPADAG